MDKYTGTYSDITQWQPPTQDHPYMGQPSQQGQPPAAEYDPTTDPLVFNNWIKNDADFQQYGLAAYEDIDAHPSWTPIQKLGLKESYVDRYIKEIIPVMAQGDKFTEQQLVAQFRQAVGDPGGRLKAEQEAMKTGISTLPPTQQATQYAADAAAKAAAAKLSAEGQGFGATVADVAQATMGTVGNTAKAAYDMVVDGSLGLAGYAAGAVGANDTADSLRATQNELKMNDATEAYKMRTDELLYNNPAALAAKAKHDQLMADGYGVSDFIGDVTGQNEGGWRYLLGEGIPSLIGSMVAGGAAVKTVTSLAKLANVGQKMSAGASQMGRSAGMGAAMGTGVAGGVNTDVLNYVAAADAAKTEGVSFSDYVKSRGPHWPLAAQQHFSQLTEDDRNTAALAATTAGLTTAVLSTLSGQMGGVDSLLAGNAIKTKASHIVTSPVMEMMDEYVSQQAVRLGVEAQTGQLPPGQEEFGGGVLMAGLGDGVMTAGHYAMSPSSSPATPPGAAATPPGAAATPPGAAATPPGAAAAPPWVNDGLSGLNIVDEAINPEEGDAANLSTTLYESAALAGERASKKFSESNPDPLKVADDLVKALHRSYAGNLRGINEENSMADVGAAASKMAREHAKEILEANGFGHLVEAVTVKAWRDASKNNGDQHLDAVFKAGSTARTQTAKAAAATGAPMDTSATNEAVMRAVAVQAETLYGFTPPSENATLDELEAHTAQLVAMAMASESTSANPDTLFNKTKAKLLTLIEAPPAVGDVAQAKADFDTRINAAVIGGIIGASQIDAETAAVAPAMRSVVELINQFNKSLVGMREEAQKVVDTAEDEVSFEEAHQAIMAKALENLQVQVSAAMNNAKAAGHMVSMLGTADVDASIKAAIDFIQKAATKAGYGDVANAVHPETKEKQRRDDYVARETAKAEAAAAAKQAADDAKLAAAQVQVDKAAGKLAETQASISEVDAEVAAVQAEIDAAKAALTPALTANTEAAAAQVQATAAVTVAKTKLDQLTRDLSAKQKELSDLQARHAKNTDQNTINKKREALDKMEKRAAARVDGPTPAQRVDIEIAQGDLKRLAAEKAERDARRVALADELINVDAEIKSHTDVLAAATSVASEATAKANAAAAVVKQHETTLAAAAKTLEKAAKKRTDAVAKAAKEQTVVEEKATKVDELRQKQAAPEAAPEANAKGRTPRQNPLKRKKADNMKTRRAPPPTFDQATLDAMGAVEAADAADADAAMSEAEQAEMDNLMAYLYADENENADESATPPKARRETYNPALPTTPKKGVKSVRETLLNLKERLATVKNPAELRDADAARYARDTIIAAGLQAQLNAGYHSGNLKAHHIQAIDAAKSAARVDMEVMFPTAKIPAANMKRRSISQIVTEVFRNGYAAFLRSTLAPDLREYMQHIDVVEHAPLDFTGDERLSVSKSQREAYTAMATRLNLRPQNVQPVMAVLLSAQKPVKPKDITTLLQLQEAMESAIIEYAHGLQERFAESVIKATRGPRALTDSMVLSAVSKHLVDTQVTTHKDRLRKINPQIIRDHATAIMVQALKQQLVDMPDVKMGGFGTNIAIMVSRLKAVFDLNDDDALGDILEYADDVSEALMQPSVSSLDGMHKASMAAIKAAKLAVTAALDHELRHVTDSGQVIRYFPKRNDHDPAVTSYMRVNSHCNWCTSKGMEFTYAYVGFVIGAHEGGAHVAIRFTDDEIGEIQDRRNIQMLSPDAQVAVRDIADWFAKNGESKKSENILKYLNDHPEFLDGNSEAMTEAERIANRVTNVDGVYDYSNLSADERYAELYKDILTTSPAVKASTAFLRKAVTTMTSTITGLTPADGARFVQQSKALLKALHAFAKSSNHDDLFTKAVNNRLNRSFLAFLTNNDHGVAIALAKNAYDYEVSEMLTDVLDAMTVHRLSQGRTNVLPSNHIKVHGEQNMRMSILSIGDTQHLVYKPDGDGAVDRSHEFVVLSSQLETVTLELPSATAGKRYTNNGSLEIISGKPPKVVLNPDTGFTYNVRSNHNVHVIEWWPTAGRSPWGMDKVPSAWTLFNSVAPKGSVEGSYDPVTGKVTLYADSLAGPERAKFVAWHELHHRGQDLFPELTEHMESMKATPLMRKMIPIIKAQWGANADGTPMTDLDAMLEATAELSAALRVRSDQYLKERYGVGVNGNVVMKFLRQMIDGIKAVFGVHTDSEVLAMIQRVDRAHDRSVGYKPKNPLKSNKGVKSLMDGGNNPLKKSPRGGKRSPSARFSVAPTPEHHRVFREASWSQRFINSDDGAFQFMADVRAVLGKVKVPAKYDIHSLIKTQPHRIHTRQERERTQFYKPIVEAVDQFQRENGLSAKEMVALTEDHRQLDFYNRVLDRSFKLAAVHAPLFSDEAREEREDMLFTIRDPTSSPALRVKTMDALVKLWRAEGVLADSAKFFGMHPTAAAKRRKALIDAKPLVAAFDAAVSPKIIAANEQVNVNNVEAGVLGTSDVGFRQAYAFKTKGSTHWTKDSMENFMGSDANRQLDNALSMVEAAEDVAGDRGVDHYVHPIKVAMFDLNASARRAEENKTLMVLYNLTKDYGKELGLEFVGRTTPTPLYDVRNGTLSFVAPRVLNGELPVYLKGARLVMRSKRDKNGVRNEALMDSLIRKFQPPPKHSPVMRVISNVKSAYLVGFTSLAPFTYLGTAIVRELLTPAFSYAMRGNADMSRLKGMSGTLKAAVNVFRSFPIMRYSLANYETRVKMAAEKGGVYARIMRMADAGGYAEMFEETYVDGVPGWIHELVGTAKDKGALLRSGVAPRGSAAKQWSSTKAQFSQVLRFFYVFAHHAATLTALATFENALESGMTDEQAAAEALILYDPLIKGGSVVEGIAPIVSFARSWQSDFYRIRVELLADELGIPTRQWSDRKVMQKVATLGAIFATAGFTLAMLSTMLMGSDDDDGVPFMEKMDSGTALQRIYYYRDEKGAKFIEMPFGIASIFAGWGSAIFRETQGWDDAEETTEKFIFAGARSLSPIQFTQSEDVGSPTGWMKAIANSNPMSGAGVRWMANDNGFGGKITAEGTPRTGFEHSSGYASTGEVYKDVAKYLYDTLGADVYPETIKYVTLNTPYVSPLVRSITRIDQDKLWPVDGTSAFYWMKEYDLAVKNARIMKNRITSRPGEYSPDIIQTTNYIMTLQTRKNALADAVTNARLAGDEAAAAALELRVADTQREAAREGERIEALIH